ncbi:two-component sensor CbrA [Vreelandella aquamarina]|jgi:signal transduction histidine kinase/Na+/proline symporter|uniref:histidine kinase n=1 Tax=Vreelandella aquamarina TaxID=77097 RepID=A0A1N6IMI2_9GAMM|nr:MULTISPECIES: ATP-binding protein [Halomonas]MCP1303201.1 ATP-binding protein [Halomonas sp. R1t8]MCP1331258.1 ATP-binding protein [Halomonas sp. R1t4]SIN60146.1 Two-component sensor kinase CbrA [Halomonas meridiana]SIN66857.1 Two-component sensor kinase CbrA [Halomonas meridiana]SIO33165.1 Two-component sensor kinase CbrA [Halomonas meridiana]
MNAELIGVVLLGLSYLGLLFGCGMAVERGWVPVRITRHPMVYTLALGVYASAWAIYGSIELAANAGFGYLAYYLGPAGAFLLAPVLLVPIQRITRTYQLSSLADLFAFRYRSRWAGTLVTLLSLIAVLPLLGIQVHTLSDAVQLLTGSRYSSAVALLFCAVIAGCAVLFGARHSHRHRHDTLLSVIAFESVIKLLAMLGLGAIALWWVFNGPQDLQRWLEGPGAALQSATPQLEAPQWRTLLLLFFAAAFMMPHLFQITFAESLSRHTLLQASWTLPLFLLLMALPVPLILWAAQSANESVPLAAYAAYLMTEHWWVGTLAFIGGLAAASGTMMMIALALSGMVLNHIVLVARPPEARSDLYGWLLWLRRALVGAVIFGGWLFAESVGRYHSLTSLGLAAFVGMAQCLPGLLALLYWPGANRKGMIAGLIGGIGVWLWGLWLPLLFDITMPALPFTLLMPTDAPAWYNATLISLAVNIVLLIVVSLFTRISEGERSAAEACSVDAVIRSKRLPLEAATAGDFPSHLAQALGDEAASREVDRALKALNLTPQERRPYALRRLRDRIQANLSGLMGPSVARDIVDRYLPYRHDDTPATDDIHFVESRLEAYRSRLTGLARELDGLRRHHRQTLAYLPVGLCVLGDDDELLMWNQALSQLSGISGESVIGSRRDSLPPPWPTLLGSVLNASQTPLYKQAVTLHGKDYFLTLHKAVLSGHDSRGGSVILVEDHTEMKWLEEELVHAARLASIGQLAAGVAHEIGNPITGISSLAQNLRYDTENPALLETADQIQQLTQRVTKIVNSLVGFAHGGRPALPLPAAPASLKTVSEDALHLIHLARSGEDVTFTNACPSDIVVRGDAQRLTQVMVNLLSNAKDACQPQGTVRIEAGTQASHAWWRVVDDGHGIDPSVKHRLFEPFTTTKPAGEGTGLGLSLAYQIINEHQGKIEVASPPPGKPRGTAITLWLPLYQQDDHLPHAQDTDC